MGYLRQKLGHHASGVTLMVVLMILGPELFLGIGVKIATAPVQDFIEMLDSRPPQTGPPATPLVEDTEDVMAIPHKIAA